MIKPKFHRQHYGLVYERHALPCDMCGTESYGEGVVMYEADGGWSVCSEKCADSKRPVAGVRRNDHPALMR